MENEFIHFLNMIINGIHIQENNKNKMQFDHSLVTGNYYFESLIIISHHAH